MVDKCKFTFDNQMECWKVREWIEKERQEFILAKARKIYQLLSISEEEAATIPFHKFEENDDTDPISEFIHL